MFTAARVSSIAAVSAALICSVSLPATAADSATTTATVTVTGGGLAISAPAAAGLGSVAPGATATVNLAGVQVSDTRAGMAGWVAQVASTDFVGGIANNEIAASAASYTPALATPTGVVVVTPSAIPVTLSATPQTVQTATVVVGNNGATWGAGLSLSVPGSALADTYTATLTHSVL